jgi:hypothetical protein
MKSERLPKPKAPQKYPTATDLPRPNNLVTIGNKKSRRAAIPNARWYCRPAALFLKLSGYGVR